MPSTTTAAAETTADLHAHLVIPAPVPGALTSWRRMILSIDAAKAGAYALAGRELRAGVAYRLPRGALVISCDKLPDHREITLWRAETGGMASVKTWTQKSPLGARIVGYIARRLPGLDPVALAGFAPLEDIPNRWDARCRHCRAQVAAGDGVLRSLAGETFVAHRGPCPPAPAPANSYAGRCIRCGGWIEAGAGQLDQIRVRHRGECPEIRESAPISANRYDDWCSECGEMLGSGAGRYEPGAGARHHWPCPQGARAYPTWRVYRPEWAPAPQQGRAEWARITVREGDCPVPADTPGFQVLTEDLIQAVTVVLDWRAARGGYLARVRTATLTEAAPLLARRIGFLPDAVPDAFGFKADYALERFGPPSSAYGAALMASAGHPWVAEITGRRRGFGGYEREFLRAKLDYSGSNSRGTRGVWCHWTLSINKVYEAHCPRSWKHSRRTFLRATPDGGVREIGRAEVDAWLDWSAQWLYSLPEGG